MTMELDEMKQAWARMDLRQEGMEALLRQDFRDRRMDKARSTMRWSLLGQAVEIACWLAFVVFVASFWVEHRHVMHLLVIGLLLHIYGIAGIWSSHPPTAERIDATRRPPSGTPPFTDAEWKAIRNVCK